MRFVLYIYFFLLSNFIFCHSEIFDITKGEFITNQDFNKNYSFNLFFKQDVFVDEIGVDFIDFGDDNFANLEIKVYNNDSLIYSKKEKFLEKNGQIVYFGLNKLFQSNKEYVFLILNLDIYSHTMKSLTFLEQINLGLQLIQYQILKLVIYVLLFILVLQLKRECIFQTWIKF